MVSSEEGEDRTEAQKDFRDLDEAAVSAAACSVAAMAMSARVTLECPVTEADEGDNAEVSVDKAEARFFSLSPTENP